MIIPENYGAILLDLLFKGAFIFACLFVVGFIALLMRRVVEARLLRKWQGVEKTAKLEVMGWLNSARKEVPDLASFRSLPESIQMEVFEGLSLMVKGDLADRLAELAGSLSIQDLLIKRMRSSRADARLAAARLLCAFRDRKSVERLQIGLDHDVEPVAAVCGEGLLVGADEDRTMRVAECLLERGIDPKGHGRRAFKIICENHPAIVIDLARDKASGRERHHLLDFLRQVLGPLMVPYLTRHNALEDPRIRFDLLDVIEGATEPAFERLRERILELNQQDQELPQAGIPMVDRESIPS